MVISSNQVVNDSLNKKNKYKEEVGFFHSRSIPKINRIVYTKDTVQVKRKGKWFSYSNNDWFNPKIYHVYIKSSLRGLHINVSDNNFRVLRTFSLGKLGYKKAQRYNRLVIKELYIEVLNYLGEILKLGNNFIPFKLRVILKGTNPQLRKFLTFFFSTDYISFHTTSVLDITDVPYNGCRPKKLRRK